jgi:tellurite resistance protein
MNDDELIAELRALGIDQDSYRAVLLLPLVQVAWADGEIQPSERELILRVALGYGLVEGKAGVVLGRWLEQPPTGETIARGRRLLVALALRHSGLGSELGPETLSEIQKLCVDTARAAGGLFDTFFTVDDNERQALDEISRELSIEKAKFLDDLPTPTGGSFEDL